MKFIMAMVLGILSGCILILLQPGKRKHCGKKLKSLGKVKLRPHR